MRAVNYLKCGEVMLGEAFFLAKSCQAKPIFAAMLVNFHSRERAGVKLKLIKIEKMSIRPCEKKIVAKRIDFNKIGFARKDCDSRSAIEGAITGFLPD